MSFQINIKPSDKIIFCDVGESILNAAIHQGVNLAYGCRNGACGACRGKILSGSVSYQEPPLGLSEQEKQAGYALLCCAIPQTDIQVECKEIASSQGIHPKIFPVRVEKLERLAPDVMGMFVKLPSNEQMQFYAGQYIEFILKDGSRRAFSLANPPHMSQMLELHLRHVAGGVFTDYVFNELKEKTILRIEGPFGNFYLREEIPHPIIFVAGGTGFAPIKAIIEDMIQHNKIQRPIKLYWGARTQADLYMHTLAQAWAEHIPELEYIPVLSAAEHDRDWQGRRGLVHQAVLQDIQDFSNWQVYCCGAPPMINACMTGFEAAGLDPQYFFSDAFSYAVSKT